MNRVGAAGRLYAANSLEAQTHNIRGDLNVHGRVLVNGVPSGSGSADFDLGTGTSTHAVGALPEGTSLSTLSAMTLQELLKAIFGTQSNDPLVFTTDPTHWTLVDTTTANGQMIVSGVLNDVSNPVSTNARNGAHPIMQVFFQRTAEFAGDYLPMTVGADYSVVTQGSVQVHSFTAAAYYTPTNIASRGVALRFVYS